MNGNIPILNATAPSGPSATDVSHADSQILRALDLIYDARSTNEHRQDATRYLEQVKSQDDAPYHGYILAANKSHPAAVRHYGLSLLESAIRQRWAEYSGEQSDALREWVLKLAQSVAKDDPLFLRNKIAQLWVEIAKRSWALDWMDMDELLVRIWGGSIAQKELVLEVLETLSETAFGKEDTTTALRGPELSKACVEIFTPAQVMLEHFPTRDTSINVRFGQEGWLFRISELLDWYSKEARHDKELQACATKALSTLKSVIHWVMLKAISATLCMQRISECLTVPNPDMQLAAIEALYTLYDRPHYTDSDVCDLVWPMYKHETVDSMKRLYEWSVVDASTIDEEKYLLCKKFSEMIHTLGRFLDTKPDLVPQEADLHHFLDLLLNIVQNESLQVSIPILSLWGILLNSATVGDLPAMMNLVGPLLEICSTRLLRYEALPIDSEVPSIIFLKEDIDTIPERHAFLGNYARYCKETIECIVQKQPLEALSHILNQTDQVIIHLYEQGQSFEVNNYSQTSIPALKIDAQFSVIEAGLNGYGRWRAIQRSKGVASLGDKVSHINQILEQWCTRLISRTFDDPTIQQRTIHLIESMDTLLRKDTHFFIRVFQFVLDTMFRLASAPDLADAVMYNEAVRECQRYGSLQLQRLALRGADHLSTVYDEIKGRIYQYCVLPAVDQQEQGRCLSALFAITQRVTSMDEVQRETLLEEFVRPLVLHWQEQKFITSLQTFAGFCDLLGLSNLQNYLISRKVNLAVNWTAIPLDEEGKALKSSIEAAQNALPLRNTKALLSISVEKTEPDTRPYEVAISLWTKYLPTILPNLLQLIGLAHTFSDPASWSGLPPELRGIPSRVLRDRYWQVGISTGSRDDFYSGIEESKLTMEGLASTIRSSLRLVREVSYRLLYSMSLLGDALYKYEELPQPLSKALFTDAAALTVHQTGVILTGLPSIIYNCPYECRSYFVPPMVTAMFDFLDRKISTEWERIDRRRNAAMPDDDLVEEMKDEAILRQLTFASVGVVVRLLDPDSNLPADHNRNGSTRSKPLPAPTPPVPTLRDFILETPVVLKSVILFCTHALRMHDSRSCGLITRVLRATIVVFTKPTAVAAEVREFISTEVLKACIESLHDPYFVDIQSDLAQLIASILNYYHELTETPRTILLSLPGMDAERVNSAIWRLHEVRDGRKQRAVVLKLLEGLRGVSVSEQGRLPRTQTKKRTAMQEKYMSLDVPYVVDKESEPDLGGVAEMFS